MKSARVEVGCAKDNGIRTSVSTANAGTAFWTEDRTGGRERVAIIAKKLDGSPEKEELLRMDRQQRYTVAW
jgi:hypothetical protein